MKDAAYDLTLRPLTAPGGYVAPSKSKLRFNCFLLRDGLDSYDQAFRVQYRPGNTQGMRRLAPGEGVPEGCVAYLKENSEKVPTWARLLTPTFSELAAIKNISHRLVIFLPVHGRTFAVCFGYGSSTLEWSHIEANFGLRFAARRFDSNAMSGIGSRRIDASARSQWVQIPSNSSIRDFEVELDGEFTRKLVGNLEDGVEFPELGAVVATDSVSFKIDTDLHSVRDILAQMLQATLEGEASRDLAFIDSLEPLRATSDIVQRLEQRLAQELFGATGAARAESASAVPDPWDVHVLAFAPPDDLSIENLHNFAALKGDESQEFDEMSLESLRSAISGLPGRNTVGSLKSVKVQARDVNGEPASQAKPLKHWLVFEAGDGQQRYLLTLGKWYALAEGYYEKLDQDLAQIEDVTSRLGLRTWDDWGAGKNHEKHYNEKATEGRSDLICLDRHPLYPRDGDGDQVEACDLLHEDGYLIHVKHYTGSQTLSHLFSQGFVSAQTLVSDTYYRDDFIEAVKSINTGLEEVARAKPPRFVTYAIAFDGTQRLPQDLPTFSKVNLRSFARRVRMVGSVPTLARIQMTFKPKKKGRTGN
ncbi:DUF6119 family protein [Streptomyces amritsarensis]|uniref:DUF6119 family protein n=1 Tax=Streptomyces amritsarensis TaxID=681158 RepID=UPI0036822FE6